MSNKGIVIYKSKGKEDPLVQGIKGRWYAVCPGTGCYYASGKTKESVIKKDG